MARAASSATRTDSSAMRLLVSITCCRVSRSQIALNRREVLHRANTGHPVHSLDVLLHAILNQAEHLLRDFLSAFH